MNGSRYVALIDRLRERPAETEWLEFKRSYHEPEQIGQYLSALANSACLGGRSTGYLVFGIDDETHEVVGTRFDPYATKAKGNQDLLPWLGAGLQPNTGFEVHMVDHPNGRVVLFEVGPARDQPVSFRQTAYVRVGASKTELGRHPEKARAIWTRGSDWSAEVCRQATLDDLDPEALDKAREQFVVKHPTQAKDVAAWDDATFLNKARVLKQSAVTNTALLLLGRPESSVLLAPTVARISWVLKDEHNRELDYEHLGPPFLLAGDRLLERVRNLTVRALPNGTLFPQAIYRNPFLADAMVELNLIDTQGGGIKRMFETQRRRSFPLPDYDLTEASRVDVTIHGRILDEQYTRLLMEGLDLDLELVMLLDRVQKRLRIDRQGHRRLKISGLVEGRYPNLTVSGSVARATGTAGRHIRERGFDRQYYMDMILALVREHGPVDRKEIDQALVSKLPDRLTDSQKRSRITNLLQDLRRSGKIVNQGTRSQPAWMPGESKAREPAH